MVEVAAPLDRLTPFQNHYCIIWIWMLDLASRLFSRLASPTGCFDLMPLPVARGQSIQMICASLFFFLGQIVRKGENGNDDFRVFENFANIFRKFLFLNGNIFILIFVYVCIQSTFFYYDY